MQRVEGGVLDVRPVHLALVQRRVDVTDRENALLATEARGEYVLHALGLVLRHILIEPHCSLRGRAVATGVAPASQAIGERAPVPALFPSD